MLLHNYILTEYFDYQERLENSHATAKSSNSSGTQHIFKSLTLNKMGVFLGLHAPEKIMVVDHFNHHLDPVRRYQSDTEAFYHFDSVVVDSTIFANGANPETGLFKFKMINNDRLIQN